MTFIIGVVILQIITDVFKRSQVVQLEVKVKNEYLQKLLDRLIKAPINLYHDITPVTRVLGYFNEDLSCMNEDLFNQVREIFDINLGLALVLGKSLWSIPQLLPIFIYYGYVSSKLAKWIEPAVDTQWKLMNACNENSNTHCKLSYSGRLVLNAHNKGKDYEKILERRYLDHQSQHRPLVGLLHRRHFLERTLKAPAKVLIIVMCIQYRGLVETLILSTIISRGESVGDRITRS